MTVTVLNDTTAELDETVIATLASGTGYTIGTPDTVWWLSETVDA